MGTERKEPAPERGESTPRTAVQSIGQRHFFWCKIRKQAPMENDRNVPATKGDVADILEALRDVETRLLNAFYGYAKTNDKRVLEVEANESVLRSRLATLESRVLDLEQKGNTPPTA